MNPRRVRLILVGVTAIWLVMVYLFYRYERSSHGSAGVAIPPQTVWRKILHAPDNSALDIYYGDQKVGFGRWCASTTNPPLLGNSFTNQENQPGAALERPGGLGLTFEGSANVNSNDQLCFQTRLLLDTNQNWADFRVHIAVQTDTWDLVALATNQSVVVKGKDENGSWMKKLTFADLRNPAVLLGDYVNPTLLGFLGLNGPLSEKSPGMEWDAHEERLKFGRSDLLVYRLDTSALGQHIRVIVSRAGEILWVDLPLGVSLRNRAVSLASPGKG